MTQPNTLFLRLEGPLQAWGDTSKFVIRRSMEAPTKSGVLGLVCCAMGFSRQTARDRLRELHEKLVMGVRIDRPGIRWWDWHTVGAKVGILNAKGEIKINAQTKEPETLITRREYLADASFLVALQGEAALIEEVGKALAAPVWPLYLGRKSCPPSVPIFVGVESRADLRSALTFQSWRPRLRNVDPEPANRSVPCLIEWRATEQQPEAPPDAEVWYDAPFSFDPPVHHPRLVVRGSINVAIGEPLQQPTPPPPRPRANYSSSAWTDRIRPARLRMDQGLCVFCKQPATTVQHITYRRAGGQEDPATDLASLCRLCHDACTMIEYGQGMGLDRIDPCDVRWRDQIIQARAEILRWRSEEGRRRALRNAPEKVRREQLEQGTE